MKKLFSNMLAVAIAAFTFVACEDVPAPYSTPQKGQQEEIEFTGSGTKADPYTTADAIAYAKSLGSEESEQPVYIKGKVVAITEEFSTQYGNGTFTISDDGTNNNVFTAYRVLYLGNKKFTANDTQIQVGDDVILYGNIVNYKGNTPETVQGSAYLYSLNGNFIDVEEGTEGTPSGDGTLENPFNAAAAIAYAKEVGDANSPKEVYIAGKIASISEEFSTQYGNGTFTISEDGKQGGSEFTCYRVLYLGNKKFTASDTQIKQGDDVIIYGKVTNFKGNTPETVQGSAYLYSLNGVTAEGGGGGTEGTPSGDGTLQNPFNAAAAIAYAQQVGDSESPKEVYIAGKVANITEQFGPQYGNGTFTISDDGKRGGSEFTCYRILYLGNKKFVSGNTEIKQGDDVIVYGKVTNFKGNTPETVQGSAYLYSLNGKTEASGSQGGGNTGTEITCAKAVELTNALADNGTSTETYTVTGYITEVVGNVSKNQQTFWMADTKDGGKVFEAYWANLPEGVSAFSAGMKVKITGHLMKYVNSSGVVTPEIKNADVVILEGGSGDNGGGNSGGEVNGNSINVTMAEFGLDNAADLTTLTLTDGTKLTFAQNGGNNPPKYYTSGKAARLYVQNSMTIDAGSKTISKVVINAYSDSNASYTAEGNVSGKAGSKTVTPTLDGTTFTFSGVSSSSLTVSNDATGTGSAKQLRIVTMTITYAD